MNTLELTNELKMIKHDSVFAVVVRQNPTEGIQMIRDQLYDGQRLRLVSIIGERLVTVIESL